MSVIDQKRHCLVNRLYIIVCYSRKLSGLTGRFLCYQQNRKIFCFHQGHKTIINVYAGKQQTVYTFTT